MVKDLTNGITKEKYLEQPEKLNKIIAFNRAEVKRLRMQTCSLSSPQLGERVQKSFNTDAPFEKSSVKIMDMERRIQEKVDLLFELNQQICESLEELEDAAERQAIQCRILEKRTWKETASEMNVSVSKARRKFDDGMVHYRIPVNPIVI